MSALRSSSFSRRGWNPRQLPRDLNFELDTGHPLTNGLVALYAPGLSLGDLLFPQNPVLGRPSAGGFTTSPYGPAWNSPTSASGSLFAAGLPTRLQSQTYTLVWIGKANGTSPITADNTVFSIGAGASPFVRVGWFLYSGASEDLHTMDSYTGAFAFSGTGVPLSSLQAPVHLVGTFNTGLQKTYLNGVATASAGVHAGTLSFNSSTDSIQFGDTRAGPGVTSVAGFIYNRFLSLDEIQRHYAAPFDMLRPVARRMYITGIPAAGSSKPLTPDAATATGTAAAGLTRSRALAPAGTAAGSATAALQAIRALTAAGTSSGTAAATLRRSRALTGAATTSAGAASGSLARTRPLTTAATTAATTQTAALRAVRALLAAGTATGTAAATLRRSRALTSAATASAGAASGSLTRTRPLTTAATTAATTQAAALHAIRALLATGTATGTAAASLARRRALLGGGTALSSQTGSIAKFTQGQLAGQGVATGTAAATLHAIRGLTAAGSASTSQAATLARSRGLATAAGAASGSQAATLRRSRRLTPAGATATTGQAAAQSAVRALVAAGAATGTAQAAMTRRRALRAAATAASGQTAAINVSGFLPAPDYIPPGNTILIPLDSRTVTVPLDARTILIP